MFEIIIGYVVCLAIGFLIADHFDWLPLGGEDDE